MSVYMGVPPSEEARDADEAANNQMLMLHTNLSASLYKERGKAYNLRSSIIVVASTSVVCFLSVWFRVEDGPGLALYLILSWGLPTILYFLGIVKKIAFFLVPWICIAGIHVVALEILLLTMAATMELWSVGCFYLLLALPLPLILSVPVKAFVYMDSEREQSGSSCCDFSPLTESPLCPRTRRSFKKTCQSMRNLFSKKRRSRQRGNHQIVPTRDNSELTVVLPLTASNSRHDLAPPPPHQPTGEPPAYEAVAATAATLHDLPVGENLEEEEAAAATVSIEAHRRLIAGEAEVIGVSATNRREPAVSDLPPSYSLAEGLAELPSYREVGVSRARIGPYVLIYDKSEAKFKSFKK